MIVASEVKGSPRGEIDPIYVLPTSLQRKRAHSAKKIDEAAKQALAKSASTPDKIDQWTPRDESTHRRTLSQEEWLRNMHKPKKPTKQRRRDPFGFKVASAPSKDGPLASHSPTSSQEDLEDSNGLEEGVISVGYSSTICVNPGNSSTIRVNEDGRSDLPPQVIHSLHDGQVTAKFMGRSPSGETTPLIANTTQWDTPQDPLLRIEEPPKKGSWFKCLWCWPK